MMLLAASTDSTAIVVALLGGGFISAVLAAFRFKPDKDAVVVTAAQGAAEILNGVIDALNEEIARRAAMETELRTRLELAIKQRNEARDEAEELRKSLGRRRHDKGKPHDQPQTS